MAKTTDFIQKIAPIIQKYAPQYGIKVCSPIIAQAILESGWGESSLAAKYHNYFGLKCGSSWKGRSVNLTTSEEYTPGTHTTIKDDFRVYGSMEEGVRGYFEFIQLPRYSNLKGITDPQEYLETIIADGYATSSKYVANNMTLVKQYDLTQFDKAQKEEKTVGKVTAEDIINVMRSWIGKDRAKGTHKDIIDLYNSYKPLARGYKVTYSDEYCDTTISAAFIKCGAVDLIGGIECGVQNHIEIFRKKGIWIEDGTITPKPGDIITFHWGKTVQPNDGYGNHIGIVEKVSGKTITTIEGNYNGKVARRNIKVGDGRIRGYARPKYGESSGGSGQDRDPVGTLSKEVKRSGRIVNCFALNVRQWAGIDQPVCKTFGPLNYGTKVEICDTVNASDGSAWYYIRYNGHYGFIAAQSSASGLPFVM